MTVMHNGFTQLGIETAISTAPPRQWYPVVLGENFRAINPQPQNNKLSVCYSRAITANVDMTDTAANRTITYISVAGETLTYVLNYPGVHWNSWQGITAIGSAIEDGSVMWGV